MQIERNVSLLQYNTLQIPVNAKYFVKIQTLLDLQELVDSEIWKTEKHYILGGGANVLFTKDYDGIILKIELKGKKIQNILDKNIIEVGAGENWSDFVEWSCENGFCGIENLIDIPGNVGTAPVSNIGAYGVEVSNFIYKVEGIDLNTFENKIYYKSDCEFAYRTSIFKHSLKENFLVTKVGFLLEKFDDNYLLNLNYKDVQNLIQEKGLLPKTSQEAYQIIREIRRNKLPDWHKIGTAGSFFANPIVSRDQRIVLEQNFQNLVHHDYDDNSGEIKYKLSAGQLIDMCGLKGWKIENGKAGTYEKHALILINEGGNADDVLHAMEYIQTAVYNKFNVRLEPEVVLV